MGIIICSLLSLEFLGSEHIFRGVFFFLYHRTKERYGFDPRQNERGVKIKESRTKLSVEVMEPRQAKSVWVPEGEPGR